MRCAAKDFSETSDGTIRVASSSAVNLTVTAPRCAKAVARTAERAAAVLSRPGARLPTPLIAANRRAGRQQVKQTRLVMTCYQRRSNRVISFACIECGAALTERRRKFCSEHCLLHHTMNLLHLVLSQWEWLLSPSPGLVATTRLAARMPDENTGRAARNGHASARNGKQCTAMGKRNATGLCKSFCRS
jgi:endogenous inhibitor of DNA gyrase (YacG/DUF329 family)